MTKFWQKRKCSFFETWYIIEMPTERVNHTFNEVIVVAVLMSLFTFNLNDKFNDTMISGHFCWQCDKYPHQTVLWWAARSWMCARRHWHQRVSPARLLRWQGSRAVRAATANRAFTHDDRYDDRFAYRSSYQASKHCLRIWPRPLACLRRRICSLQMEEVNTF